MLRWLLRWFARAPTPAAPAARRVAPVAAAPPPAPFDADLVLSSLGVVPEPADQPGVVMQLENKITEIATSGRQPIPPFPSAAAHILELVEQPDLDLNELVRTLHWEPAMATELLSLASSPAVGAGRFDDLRSAVMALGIQEVATLATTVSARGLFEPSSKSKYDLFPDLWRWAHRETLVVAFVAGWLANARHLPRPDRVFLRAVLVGTGRALALDVVAQQILDGELPWELPPHLIETALDGVWRIVGHAAFAQWQLPPSLTEVMEPTKHDERAIVDLVAAVVEIRRIPARDRAEHVADVARVLGLDASWIHVMANEIDATTERLAAMFDEEQRLAS